MSKNYKQCPFTFTKGPRKGDKCQGIVTEGFEVCREHRRVIKYRAEAMERAAKKWGYEVPKKVEIPI